MSNHPPISRHQAAFGITCGGASMSSLPGYQDKYPNIRFERDGGVLQLTLHRDGGEFIVSEPALRGLGNAFIDVAEDSENRVVILTGTGDRFATQFDYGSFIETMRPDVFEYWIRTRTDGVRLLQAFLDIEVPVISALNGPVVTHSETPLLADVVLATPDTVFEQRKTGSCRNRAGPSSAGCPRPD